MWTAQNIDWVETKEFCPVAEHSDVRINQKTPKDGNNGHGTDGGDKINRLKKTVQPSLSFYRNRRHKSQPDLHGNREGGVINRIKKGIPKLFITRQLCVITQLLKLEILEHHVEFEKAEYKSDNQRNKYEYGKNGHGGENEIKAGSFPLSFQ